MDDAYMEALARAAGSLAAQSKAKEERDKQNNPLYKIGSILEPVGAIADMIPGVPPVMGAAAGAIKNLGAGDTETAAKQVAGSAANFVKWKSGRDEKDAAEKAAKAREERESREFEKFLTLFK